MAKQVQQEESREMAEKRAILAQLIADHTPAVGENSSLLPGLVLFRRTATTSCYRGVYEPSLNVYAQGRKQVTLGAKTYLCGGTSFLLSSIDVPVQSQIVEASERTPLLSLLLRLDMPIVREILTTEELSESDTPTKGIGLAVGELNLGILDVCSRLIALLNTPKDIPFLSKLIQREIIYRLLCSPQGQRLRAIATSGDLSHRTAKAITWLKINYTKPLHMEDLAGIARMGVSTLHHQFRALTAMSPLQYQKQLRLQAAREHMLTEGMDATSAAYEVGYESVSQFNREYSRFFGQPPIRDIKTLRSTASSGLSVA